MVTRRINFVCYCPDEATVEDIAQYIQAALSSYGGSLHPPYPPSDPDNPGDPLFYGINVKEIIVSRKKFIIEE